VTTNYTPVMTGTLINTGDTIVMQISGTQWATAYVKYVGATPTPTVSVQLGVSLDGGINWLVGFFGAPMGKRLTAVSANPTLDAMGSGWLGGATDQLYEVPLPANATHLRYRAVTGGTAGTMVLMGGSPYVGLPVTGVLWDFTSTAGSAASTGTFDMSGWSTAEVLWQSAAGNPGININQVNDDGTTGGVLAATANLNGLVTIGPGGTTLPLVGTASYMLPRRIEAHCGAFAAQTTRIRVEVRR
jgi:hypothetical protein